jgi:hypothetical protein
LSDPYDMTIIDDRLEVTRAWSLHFMLIPASHARI